MRENCLPEHKQVDSHLNTGTTPFTPLTVADDLGGYAFNGATVYPLRYTEGSLRYYLNGVLQTAPVVTGGPTPTISGVTVPAGGNALLIYEASVTPYAPLGAEATITNTATITVAGLTAPLTVTATIGMEQRADLSISKSLCPSTVTENGQLTYTFVIENAGSLAADASEAVVLTDTFDPKLSGITVALNGATWTQETEYTYNAATGVFATTAGQLTVPAATYTQTADGTWRTMPGTAVLTIMGTV